MCAYRVLVDVLICETSHGPEPINGDSVSTWDVSRWSRCPGGDRTGHVKSIRESIVLKSSTFNSNLHVVSSMIGRKAKPHLPLELSAAEFTMIRAPKACSAGSAYLQQHEGQPD
jgi:hypothetical protein